MEGLSSRPAPLFAAVRRLYDWVLSWADHRLALPALFLLAFAEASFFPIPPDVLLMALAMSKPRGSFLFSAVCLAGSVAGGAFGYFLGMAFMNTVGQWIIEFYHLADQYSQVMALYDKYGAWAVAAGGFTPLPYKLFTVTAGAFKMDFAVFMAASLVSRGARFLAEAALFWLFGPPIKQIIDRYFGLFTIVFMILLIGGFIALKWII